MLWDLAELKARGRLVHPSPQHELLLPLRLGQCRWLLLPPALLQSCAWLVGGVEHFGFGRKEVTEGGGPLLHHKGPASSAAQQGVFSQGCFAADDFAQYESASSGLASKSFLYRMEQRKGCSFGQVLTITPRITGCSQDGGMEEEGWRVQRRVRRPWFYASF